MLYKAREKPQLLYLLELLDRRMQLDKKTQQIYYNIKKGYEGEVRFDQFLEQLTCQCLILNDLLFEANNTTFQIDTLIITQKTLYIYEIKCFAGDYSYEGDKLFKLPQLEVINPILQLSRAESLLRQMLLKQSINVMIDASVIFIDPEFMLYQASVNQPIILNAQLKRYLHTLNKTPSQLTIFHYQIAEKLVQLHQTYSRHAKQPTYEFNELKKGITCQQCGFFLNEVRRIYAVCERCNFKERITDAVMRSVKEFTFLFPDEKITTNIIHSWCKRVNKRIIRSILQNNFKVVGSRQWTYYE